MSEILGKFKKGWIRESAGLRLVIIGVLTLLFLIPTFMVQSHIWERQGRRNAAVTEVSQKWGRAQMVAGPVLNVPYLTYHRDKNGMEYTKRHTAHFLPEELHIRGTVDSEVRYRGIFEVILYTGDVGLSGHFGSLDFAKLGISKRGILWDKAWLSVGISDMKGIRETIAMEFADSELPVEPGTRLKDTLRSGINSPLSLKQDAQEHPFTIGMSLRGSETINFVPLGEKTTASVSADWGTPSFTGEFLPDNRKINEESFTADWKVLHLNRNYPQAWTDSTQQLASSAFGVNLLMPVDGYQRTMRTVKYAIMFIFLTFFTFFIIEILNRKAVHPIQYLLIGSALLVFYILLLSLSEHILFNISYIIASVCIVAMVTLYTRSVLKDNRLAMMVGGLVTGLYGFMFVVLQAEDYALLLGSLGLFIILGLTMYLTRGIDWYTVLGTKEAMGELNV